MAVNRARLGSTFPVTPSVVLPPPLVSSIYLLLVCCILLLFGGGSVVKYKGKFRMSGKGEKSIIKMGVKGGKRERTPWVENE